MTNGKYTKFLDFPKLPIELERMCLDQINNKDAWLFSIDPKVEFNTVINGQKMHMKQAIFEVFQAPVAVIEWLKSNGIVTSDEQDVNVQRTTGGNVLLPHIDSPIYGIKNSLYFLKIEPKMRKTARNYLLTEPGPLTHFYNTTNLDDICETFYFEKYQWHDLDVTQLHGVSNIQSDRISLSVSFY